MDEIDAGLDGAIDEPLGLRRRRARACRVFVRMATACHEHEDGESSVAKAHAAVVYFLDARSIALSTVLVIRDT